MRKTTIAVAFTCLLIANAPIAEANVTYRWSDPNFITLPPDFDSITVTDAAYRSGSLTFDASCGPEIPLCTPPCCDAVPPPSGWVSGFQFPSFDSLASVSLEFRPDGLLNGFLHVNLDTGEAYTFTGEGLSWTAVIDSVESFSETGFYQMVVDPPPDPVPEPVSIAVLLAGLAGLAFVQQKRRRARA